MSGKPRCRARQLMGREQALSCRHRLGVLANAAPFHSGFKFSFWPFFSCFPVSPFVSIFSGLLESVLVCRGSEQAGREHRTPAGNASICLTSLRREQHPGQGLGAAEPPRGTRAPSRLRGNGGGRRSTCPWPVKTIVRRCHRGHCWGGVWEQECPCPHWGC